MQFKHICGDNKEPGQNKWFFYPFLGIQSYKLDDEVMYIQKTNLAFFIINFIALLVVFAISFQISLLVLETDERNDTQIITTDTFTEVYAAVNWRYMHPTVIYHVLF